MNFNVLKKEYYLMEKLSANTINEKIRSFIINSVKIPDLSSDDNLFETGIVNSLFAIQMMTFLEKTFSIRVTTDDLLMENFKSVNSATSFVLQKKNS